MARGTALVSVRRSTYLNKDYEGIVFGKKKIANKEGICPSMVGYLMRKAPKEVEKGESTKVFKPIYIIPQGDAECNILIITNNEYYTAYIQDVIIYFFKIIINWNIN